MGTHLLPNPGLQPRGGVSPYNTLIADSVGFAPPSPPAFTSPVVAVAAMGPAGRLGLCLVLSAVPRAVLEPLGRCLECPMSACLNATHCWCPPGFRAPPGNSAPPWPRESAALQSCDDIDECAEGGAELCGGGTVCFNTPGSYECHCPPGHVGTPNACAPVTVPPELCDDEQVRGSPRFWGAGVPPCPPQSGCELAETLTHLYGRLRGGGDPHLVLQELLATLEGAFWGAAAAPPPQRHRRVTALLTVTEALARGGAALLPPHSVTNITFNGSVLLLAVQPVPPPGPVRLGGPAVNLEVPAAVAGDRDSGLSLVALLELRALPRLLLGAPSVDWGGWGELPPPSRRGFRPSYRLLSPVATAFVTRPRPPGTPEVTLSFQHPPPDPRWGGRILCAFWHPEKRLWATGGCRAVTPPPPNGTACACNHLTSFAVLLAFYELQDDWVLDVVTRVGLGLSVAALAASVATFTLCRALKGLRTTLHLHLSLSLLVAHSTFLGGIDRTENPVACAVVAALLHFSFLAAFCWMGLEGLHLYVLLVRVFEPSWLRVRHLLLVGYGVPALLVTIAAAAFPAGYGTDRYCWLSLERGFRWSFQGPVCLIVAVNAVILVVTVWKLVQKYHDVNPDLGHLRRMRVLAATAGGQLFLLGSGWALGLGLGLGLPPPLPSGPPPNPGPPNLGAPPPPPALPLLRHQRRTGALHLPLPLPGAPPGSSCEAKEGEVVMRSPPRDASICIARLRCEVLVHSPSCKDPRVKILVQGSSSEAPRVRLLVRRFSCKAPCAKPLVQGSSCEAKEGEVVMHFPPHETLPFVLHGCGVKSSCDDP
ncbi:adhesion G protein-coupled receptor E5-like [Cuculus canorus]|uniref:adhesion G protein-coupled receptor E5-like n=1 Tax=Cuculus canorus TaxID=55661 RepID=UPI0023AB55AD|nr:adhesion G protein-coupled receptor E5-like [Cuculus canorus]